MLVHKQLRSLAALTVLAAAPGIAFGQILTDSDFLASDYTSSTANLAQIEFNVDYSSYDIFNDGFIVTNLPEAPNSDPGDTATTGVFLSVNNDTLNPASGAGALAAIVRNGLSVGNGTANEDYKVTIDVFNSSATGIAGTQIGTTNYGYVGINQTNTTVQVAGFNAPGSGNLSGQGLGLSVTGDSGAAEDYAPIYGGAFYQSRPGVTTASQIYDGDFNNGGVQNNIGLVTDQIGDFWAANGFEYVDSDSNPNNDLNIFSGDSLYFAPDPNNPAAYVSDGSGQDRSYYADFSPAETGVPTHYGGDFETDPGFGPPDAAGFQDGIQGNRWATHEIYWVDGEMTYVIDGTPVQQITPVHDPVGTNENIFDPFSESGSVVLGFWDRFSSISLNPEGANFIVYDNLVVETATPADVPDVDAFIAVYTTDASDPIDTDFDDDGDTDISDLLIQQRGFGIGTTNAEGDTDADGDVDADDQADALGAFGAGSLASSATATVPEPTSALLALFALAGLGVRRR
ncbi:MAG: PEP-CTERM sorting domain-containing protein [Planctomycetota bacterium]